MQFARHCIEAAAIGLIGAAFVLAAVRPAGAATLEILPDAAPPGAEALIRGQDYGPGQRLEIRLVATADGSEFVLGAIDADDSGRIFGRRPLPDAPAGAYRGRAIGPRGGVLATTTFEITTPPALGISPRSGPPGTVVDVDFGPVPPGTVEIHYDGIPALGPLRHPGGQFARSFLVPADRPKPLGASVAVRAIARAGGSISGVAETTFTSSPAESPEPTLVQFSGPGEPLSPGEEFGFSGQLQVPSNRSPSDYRLTAALVAANGDLVPVNIQPIAIDAAGNFTGQAVAPSPVSGTPLAMFGETTELGLVYKLPGVSGFLSGTTIVYEPFEVQNLKFNVTDSNGNPVETAVVNVFANTLFVPPGYNFAEHGFPDISSSRSAGQTGGKAESTAPGDSSRAAGETVQKPTWSALYAEPNQYHDAIQQVKQSIQFNLNDVTGCPVTLTSGLTDANGNFEVNAVPFINYLLDKGAQSVSQLDINTTVLGPGKATFSVKIGAVHLGLGLINNQGKCTGQRFDFQYDYNTETWNLRDGLDGDFTLSFDPNSTIPVELEQCDAADIGIPAAPYMPGLPAKEVTLLGEKIRRFGAIWSFPDTNFASLTREKDPQFRLPHLPAVFGLLEDPRLFLDNVDVGALTVEGAACGEDGVDYVIDLPQLVTRPPGIVTGRVEASMLNGTPVTEFFQLDIRTGPTWINNSSDFENRIIFWKPQKVTLQADEPERTQTANKSGIPFGVGDLENDNMSAATVRQVLLPTGAAARRRTGAADSTAASNPTDMVDNDTVANGSSPTVAIPIGDKTPITVLDTGKIPLFRYVWGFPPIADATVGADIWFKALYRYFGEIIHTNSQVLVDLTTEAIANAGLDLWFDVSIILDVVSFDASALPEFGLGMPFVIDDNKLDANASKPCFEFLIDVAWSVQVGWCPFCVEGGGTTNLFDVSEPDQCSVAGVGSSVVTASTRGSEEIPAIPVTDRTSIAVDGMGAAMLVWGDETGQINVQPTLNGVPALLQQLPAGPGAMAPDVAYFDAGRAVMVWAQSALSETDFMALNGDPTNPLDGDIETALASQHMVYRVLDGGTWSDTMTLTAPSGGDGRVVLAACPANDPACPAGGEVFAVWVHDASGNINLHDLKLRYAFFDGLNWSTPQDVDPSSTAKDLQPAVTYLDGDPVVFWIRNPSVVQNGDSASFDLNQRRIAYRFVRQSAGVEVPANLPLGVASPSVQAFGDNALALAFSKATESDAFLGSRRSLHTAFLTQCFAGTCSVGGATERTDSKGRKIFVERPSLTRNAAGQGVITFRQLGTDAPLPGDPAGVLNHTGALMQLSFEFDPATPDPVSDPFVLGADQGVGWHLDAVYDPASNGVLASAVQIQDQNQAQIRSASSLQAATDGSGQSSKTRLDAQGASQRLLDGSPVLLTQRPMLPDFELIAAELASPWIAEGSSTTLTATLRNNGPAWSESAALQVATFWDGPAGLGMPGPTLSIDELATGKSIDFTISVPLPPGFNADDEHQLHVVVNPQAALQEADAGNNEAVLEVGRLPAPRGISVVDGIATGTIVIQWDGITDDPRVTGYRVYRSNPDGSVLNVGSSPVAGFADFSSYADQRYEYFITSHSARLMESAPSKSVVAATLSPDMLFRNGFE